MTTKLSLYQECKKRQFSCHYNVRIRMYAEKFWATVAPSNERSMRLLTRLGYQEISPSSGWPTLASYDPGDRVFRLIPSQA
jgi:hypothetical protein